MYLVQKNQIGTKSEEPDLVMLFETYLRNCSYANNTIARYLATANRIIRSVKEDHRPEKGFEILVGDFSTFRSRYSFPNEKNVRAVFNHLKRIYRKTQPPPSKKKLTFVERELEAFENHLERVCGLASATRISRLQFVRKFLNQYSDSDTTDFSNINQTYLMNYIAQQARKYSPGTGSVMATSIRSYLKFLQFRGDFDPQLTLVIPSPPNHRLKSYPKTITVDEVKTLLNAFNRTKPKYKRDYAMALCMIDLGLRSSEVANLELADIDWNRSVIHLVHNKNRISRELPIMKRCGCAIAEYLHQGRPQTTCRKVFVRHAPPIGIVLKAENVRGAMRSAYKRAGFPREWTGTHILRHTAATRMLNNGASLKEIADVLGHKSIDTTITYTKLNLVALKMVCQAWPGAQS